jgi:RNA polymerase sigma-70 factor (ECF subfamily)
MPANSTAEPAEGTSQTIPRAPVGAEDFERIYRLYETRVYRLCLHMVGNPADAEELTQDTFLQVFRKLDTYRGESAFSTWLHRVAVNVVLMKIRKNRGRVETPLDQVVETEEGGEIQVNEARVDDPRLVATVDRLSLQRALLSLPVRQRLAFVLHDVEGYTHEEIAGLVGCTVESSKYQTHTARLNMRGLLQDYAREKADLVEEEPVSRRAGRRKQARNGLRRPAVPVQVAVEG